MKRASAGIIAGLLLLPQAGFAQSAPPSPGVANVVRETLSNGMHVVLLPSKLAPVATTVITYGVGSADDTMPGIAHATEHMMFRGTKNVSAQQFAIMGARAGADYNATTQDTYTDYYFKLPSAYVGLALRLEADRMTNALDRESDWTTERGAIEQEVRAHESVPGASVFAKMRRAFFGDTPYARDGVGTVPSFQRMHAADIARFYHAWYHPNNATLVVAGDIDPAATLAEIHRDFDPIPKGNLPQHKPVAIATLNSSVLHDTIAELPVPVAAEAFRFPSLSSADFAAGQILAYVLNSRRGAFADLQAKGQLLGAGAVQGAYPDAGELIVMGIGLPGTTPELTQSSLDAVLDDYRKTGVPADLVNAAKSWMLSQQDYREASVSGMANTWASSLAVGQASPDDIYNAISGVTLDDVNRVLRTYLDSKHAIIALLTPKNVRTLPRSDSGAVTDTVGVTPSHDEPLPSWALRYFNTALRAPAGDGEVATYRLSNGIRLTVRRETLSPTVYLSGSIRMSPDLYEPAHREGVAQITNTLLLWGTQTFDRKAFQAQFDAVSASGTLGPDFSLQVQSKNFDRALGLIADGLLHPAFPQDGLDVVKNDAARTLAAVEHQPGTQAALARIAALYPKGDPRRRRATPDSVKAISMADVQHWYAFAFRPDETTIAVVGNVAPADVKAAVERYFGAWKANGKRPSFEYPKIKTNKSQSVTVNSASSTQSDVTLTQVIGVHRGDDDYIALELANTILSDEGIGSMLFRDLRERKGYVYDVSSSMDIGRSSSTFSIEFQSDPKNVKAAQSAAVADIRRLQNALVPLDELQRAKALVLARRVLPLDSYEGIADDILDTARSGETRDDDAAFWQELLETTPQQIRAAMRRWINPGHFSRVIIAPDP